jgi:hypothetical protein
MLAIIRLLMLLLFLSQTASGFASETEHECGSLPIADSAQAVCRSMHYLRQKSEFCAVPGFTYATSSSEVSWLVVATPQDWENSPRCTGDVLELDSENGELVSWRGVDYHDFDNPKATDLCWGCNVFKGK